MDCWMCMRAKGSDVVDISASAIQRKLHGSISFHACVESLPAGDDDTVGNLQSRNQSVKSRHRVEDYELRSCTFIITEARRWQVGIESVNWENKATEARKP